jgi:oxygen-independent coproporphyrinogen-3 oxidase
MKAVWPAKLLAKYDVNGPRYTSYPTANLFSEAFDARDARSALESIESDQDLSLYVHVPFCDTVCYYCACNKIITNNRKHAVGYLEYLYREIGILADMLGRSARIRQLHFGGGTPTYLTDDQFQSIFRVLEEHFELAGGPDRDFSIEIDPRTVDEERINTLADMGINRISLGVQDFDADVQQAVNRIQSVQDTALIVNAARKRAVESISMDLIYGLPLQSVASFSCTLEKVIELSPDRLSLYSYAHLPGRFKTQKQIKVVDLPVASAKLNLLHLAVETLQAAGYEYVGMDHFAKRTDTLISASQDGTMHRSFQGYTTHGDCPLVGLGVSAISQIDGVYYQNAKTLDAYYEGLDGDRLPIERGIALTDEDFVRRDVIQRLMCHFQIDVPSFERHHRIRFTQYFAEELSRLEPMIDDDLVRCDDNRLSVTNSGRFFIRNICMAFDAYLNPSTGDFSKAI